MTDRKAKRLSNPTIDTKMSKDCFSKWAMKMQLLIPPSKKHRPADHHQNLSDKEESELLNSDDRKRLHRRGVYLGYPPSPLQQLPSPPLSPIPDDSPKDASQCWSLFCSTHEKLRRNKLPLSEIVHLRRMLSLLKEKSNGRLNDSLSNQPPHIARYQMVPTMMYPTPVFCSPLLPPQMKRDEDDDDIPLVSLMNSNQPTTVSTFYRPQIYSPYTFQQPHFYYRS